MNSLELLHPDFRRKVAAILHDLAQHGVKAIAYETYRSQELQEQYYRQGVTELKRVGVHHYGLAADIVPLDWAGNPTWDNAAAFRLLARLAKLHGLISGSDWGHPERKHRFVDAPHVQMVSIEQQPALFSGAWYPDIRS